MQSNPFKNARLLLLISGVAYILIGLLVFVLSYGQQVDIHVNDTQMVADLWEMTGDNTALILWALLVIVPVLIGIIAIWYRTKRPEQMKKPFGIIFIVIGAVTFFTGVGVLLAIAGGQVIILRTAYAKGYRLNPDKQ